MLKCDAASVGAARIMVAAVAAAPVIAIAPVNATLATFFLFDILLNPSDLGLEARRTERETRRRAAAPVARARYAHGLARILDRTYEFSRWPSALAVIRANPQPARAAGSREHCNVSEPSVDCLRILRR